MPRSRGHPKQRSNLRWHPLGKPQIPAVIMQGQEDKKRENRGAQGKQKQAPMKGACEGGY